MNACQRWYWAVFLATAAMSLVACGGSGGGGSNGGGGGDAPSLTGWWMQQGRGSATDPWLDFAILSMQDDPPSLRFHGHDGLVSGARVRWAIPDAVDPLRQVWDVTIDDPTRMTGSLEQFTGAGASLLSDLRLIRTAAPDGVLTLHGQMNLVTVDQDATTAYARLRARGSGYSLYLHDSRPDGLAVVTIAFSTSTPGFVPETDRPYALGVHGGVTTVLEYYAGGAVHSSSEGTVMFTRALPTVVEGSYTAEFGPLKSLRGVFSAPVLITE